MIVAVWFQASCTSAHVPITDITEDVLPLTPAVTRVNRAGRAIHLKDQTENSRWGNLPYVSRCQFTPKKIPCGTSISLLFITQLFCSHGTNQNLLHFFHDHQSCLVI